MPGVGKMFATAGAGTSWSLAGGGGFLGAADRAEPLAIAVRGGMSPVAVGGEARMTGGGDIGTSGASGVEPLAAGRGDKTPGPAGLLHHQWRPPQ
jgi:hypothetical protein